jgi:AcrR family transcriptional regulator
MIDKFSPLAQWRSAGSPLEVAAEMIADQGLESVALRSMSEYIGVPLIAPYRHFADKSTLPAAIAEEGFKGLYTRIQKRNR